MSRKDYQTLKISDKFTIHVDTTPRKIELSDLEEREIERVWEREKKIKGDHLFNGQLLNYSTHDETQLTGYFIEYKHYLAQLHNPSLYETLRVEGIGISGVTRAGDFVLFGKRAAHVTTHPLFYELAPAGGIDPSFVRGEGVPLSIPFIQEMYEEVGVQEESVLSIKPFALVYDREMHLYEVCANIELDVHILEKSFIPSLEYDALCWVPQSDLGHFISMHKQEIVPLSLFLLELV